MGEDRPKLVEITGAPLTDELKMLFAPFGGGAQILGVVLMPGDSPYIAAEYKGRDAHFQLRFDPSGAIEIDGRDVLRPVRVLG